MLAVGKSGIPLGAALDQAPRGQLPNLSLPPKAVHLGVGLLGFLVILTVGLAAGLHRSVSENGRLAVENAALKNEYDSLLSDVEERDLQLESLGGLAYQISAAYGLQRSGTGIDALAGTDPLMVYDASIQQYEWMIDSLASAVTPVAASGMLVNTTPSIWPVKGSISSSYGTRQDPFTGKGVFHSGVDLRAPGGSVVVAAADGYVVQAGWDRALGHCVTVGHGQSGFTTVYGHLEEYFVRPGQLVRRGEVIGVVGRSGRATGRHLHYEVHSKGLSVNPYRYLRGNQNEYRTLLAD